MLPPPSSAPSSTFDAAQLQPQQLGAGWATADPGAFALLQQWCTYYAQQAATSQPASTPLQTSLYKRTAPAAEQPAAMLGGLPNTLPLQTAPNRTQQQPVTGFKRARDCQEEADYVVAEPRLSSEDEPETADAKPAAAPTAAPAAPAQTAAAAAAGAPKAGSPPSKSAREKNRQAQARFRERQKGRIIDLQTRVETLQKRSDDLEKENAHLRKLLAESEARGAAATSVLPSTLGAMQELHSLASAVAAAPPPDLEAGSSAAAGPAAAARNLTRLPPGAPVPESRASSQSQPAGHGGQDFGQHAA